ncbi:hypothetical protein C8R47DRAFT_1081629 [Mycena vitilis]|nr:hypothetical protein C8R47DRAFT_1081629 [Mycena vitilis]
MKGRRMVFLPSLSLPVGKSSSADSATGLTASRGSCNLSGLELCYTRRGSTRCAPGRGRRLTVEVPRFHPDTLVRLEPPPEYNSSSNVNFQRQLTLRWGYELGATHKWDANNATKGVVARGVPRDKVCVEDIDLVILDVLVRLEPSPWQSMRVPLFPVLDPNFPPLDSVNTKA